jgi:hypothetical protein
MAASGYSQPAQVSIVYFNTEDPPLGCPCQNGAAYGVTVPVYLWDDINRNGPDAQDSVLNFWVFNGLADGWGDGYFTSGTITVDSLTHRYYVQVSGGACCWYTRDIMFTPGPQEFDLVYADWTCGDQPCEWLQAPPPAPTSFRASDDSLCMEIVTSWEYAGPAITGFIVYEDPASPRFLATPQMQSCVISPNPYGSGRFFVTAYNETFQSLPSNEDAGSSYRLRFAAGAAGDVQGTRTGGSEFTIAFEPSFGSAAGCPTIDSLILLSDNLRAATLCVDSMTLQMTCSFPDETLENCRLVLVAATADERHAVWYDTTESVFTLTGTSALDQGMTMPRRSEITGAYPNPFNPETRIAFTVSKPGTVRLAVYNLAGEKVRTLMQDNCVAGDYVSAWNGQTDARTTAASGLYLCRLETSTGVSTQRILLMK